MIDNAGLLRRMVRDSKSNEGVCIGCLDKLDPTLIDDDALTVYEGEHGVVFLGTGTDGSTWAGIFGRFVIVYCATCRRLGRVSKATIRELMARLREIDTREALGEP